MWVAADTNRIPFGTAIGAPNNPELQSVTNHQPVTPGIGSEVFAITVTGEGGQRHGWMRNGALLPGSMEIEFNPNPNQPMALGLPAEPRWLPRLDAGQEQLPPPYPGERLQNVLATYRQQEPLFNSGVVALAATADGTLFGVGLDREERYTPGLSEVWWKAHLFSMNSDGSQFRQVANLGTNAAARPQFSLTTTSQGRVLVNRSGGPLHRYDPATGTLTHLQSQFPNLPRLTSAIQPLSDGQLCGISATALVMLDSEGESPQIWPVPNRTLRDLNTGVVEGSDGWLYMVAQRGGEAQVGGILRCRRDGTESSVVVPFAALAGSRTEYRPTRELLATLVKSPLCLAPDGSFYGSMRQRLFNLVYRVTPDGAIQLVHFNQWSSGPEGRFTNGLGGWTWSGPFSRGIFGGWVRGDDGHVYGLAQYEWNGDYPGFPAAVLRIRVPEGRLETLSQSSWLETASALDEESPLPRTIPWVRGAEGVLYFGGYYGVMSYRPGSHGIRPLRITGRNQPWSPTSLGAPVRDDQGRYLAVTPIGGAFQEGILSVVNSDGSEHRVLHAFSGGDGDVRRPSGFLAPGSDGWVYGTSHQGHSYDLAPKLWRVHRETGAFDVLASLPGRDDGRATLPYGLVRGSDGRFYGTTPYGGAADLGTLYRYEPGENRILILHEFGTTPGDRWQPWPQLLEGRDGYLYGLATGENLGPQAPDGWFRIATDGSDYQVLGTLERSADSPLLQITGGLTESKDRRFYCVRGLAASAPTNAPIIGQILRLTLPAQDTGPARVEVLFENAAGNEPFLSPVGNLIELPTGELLGVGRSKETAVFTIHPDTKEVRRIHRWGMRHTSRHVVVTDRFARAVLENPDSLVVLAHEFLVRVHLTRSETPEALPPLRVTGTYGDSAPHLNSDQLFTNAFFLAGAQGLPEGVQFKGLANGDPFGSISGWFGETGVFDAEVFTADGRWPAYSVTNHVIFDIQKRPLTLTGPSAVWVTGEPQPLPADTAGGFHWSDLRKVTVTWKAAENAAQRPGTHPLQPEIEDPENRLRFYQVSVQEGRLTVVDRETRMVQLDGTTHLEFPPLPDHRFVVRQAASLSGPWVQVHSTRGKATGLNRFRLDPATDDQNRYFRIEATY